LAHRLRLFRAAWGEAAEITDLAGLARGLPRAERIRVDVSGVGDDTAQRQLAASLMVVAASGLPRGGTVWIGEREAEAGLAVRIEGPRAAWPAAMVEQLAGLGGGAVCAVDPLTAGLAIAWLQARLLGMSIDIVSPTALAIRAFTESSAGSGQSAA
jgi:hypothetical protein